MIANTDQFLTTFADLRFWLVFNLLAIAKNISKIFTILMRQFISKTISTHKTDIQHRQALQIT